MTYIFLKALSFWSIFFSFWILELKFRIHILPRINFYVAACPVPTCVNAAFFTRQRPDLSPSSAPGRWIINNIRPKCFDCSRTEPCAPHFVTITPIVQAPPIWPFKDGPKWMSPPFTPCWHCVTLLCLGLKGGNWGLMEHVRDPSCSTFRRSGCLGAGSQIHKILV